MHRLLPELHVHLLAVLLALLLQMSPRPAASR